MVSSSYSTKTKPFDKLTAVSILSANLFPNFELRTIRSTRVASLILLVFKGLNFGIDFKGGTLIELRSTDTKISVSSLRDKFSQMNLGDVSVKKFGNDTDYLIKFENKDNKKNISPE